MKKVEQRWTIFQKWIIFTEKWLLVVWKNKIGKTSVPYSSNVFLCKSFYFIVMDYSTYVPKTWNFAYIVGLHDFSSSFLVNLHLLSSFSPSQNMVFTVQKKEKHMTTLKKGTIFKEKDFSCRFTLSKLKIYYLILLICVFIKSTFNPEFSRFWVMIDPVVFNDWVNFEPLFLQKEKKWSEKILAYETFLSP